jgi:hypothetical protein
VGTVIATIPEVAAGNSSATATPTWVNVAIALAGSAVAANVAGGVIARLRATADARRERYAAAARLLVARIEYPYRVRRRTSDDPVLIATLADRGHDLQEQLADAKAWVTAESRAMGDLYSRSLIAIDQRVAPACREAWDSDPVDTPSGMNVGDFGPRGVQRCVDRFTCAAHYRFGWRRILPNRLLRRLLTSDERRSERRAALNRMTEEAGEAGIYEGAPADYTAALKVARKRRAK